MTRDDGESILVNRDEATPDGRSKRLIRRRKLLAGSVALGASLAGCGGGDGSTPTPTDSPTASPTPTATPTPEFPLLVEDFAADSLDTYEGAADEFEIVQEPTHSGEYALADETAYWGKGSIYRTGDLPHRPGKGDTIEVSIYLGETEGEETTSFWGTFHFAVAENDGIVATDEGQFNPANCVVFQLDGRPRNTDSEHGILAYRLFDGNELARETSAPFSRVVPEGEWLTGRIDWGTDGTLEMSLLDDDDDELAAISSELSTRDGGGIGFRQGGSAGHAVYWDYVRITDR